MSSRDHIIRLVGEIEPMIAVVFGEVAVSRSVGRSVMGMHHQLRHGLEALWDEGDNYIRISPLGIFIHFEPGSEFGAAAKWLISQEVVVPGVHQGTNEPDGSDYVDLGSINVADIAGAITLVMGEIAKILANMEISRQIDQGIADDWAEIEEAAKEAGC